MNDEVYLAIDYLFSEFWILRAEQPEKYRLILRNRKEVRAVLNQRFGLNLIYHSRFFQVQKRPLHPQRWMGLSDFTDPMDYALLMGALAFTEEKNEKSAFLMSELVEELQRNFPADYLLDWQNYRHRRSLVRGLNQMLKLHLIETIEGETENFLEESDQRGDVLYQVTVFARYFLGNRPEAYSEFQDFQQFEQFLQANTRLTRSQRVYQRLMLEPVILRDETTLEEFDYLRKEFNSLENYFEQTAFRFELTRDTAMLTSNQRKKNKTFPTYHVKDEILLQLIHQMRGQLPQGDEYGRILISKTFWQEQVLQLKEQNQLYWSKEFRTLSLSDLMSQLAALACENQLMAEIKQAEYVIFPSMARVQGHLSERTGNEEDAKNDE